MPNDSEPPSSGSKLLVQRRLDGDCRKWWTVRRVTPDQMPIADEWLRVAKLLNPATEWRVVREP